MAAQAWADSGIIIKDDGFSVRWRPKCPYCGYVPMNSERGGTAQQGVRANNFVICDKCGKNFNVVITRG